MIAREGKFIAALPQGTLVVGMTEFKGTIIVALSCGVYRLMGDEFVPIKFTDVPYDSKIEITR